MRRQKRAIRLACFGVSAAAQPDLHLTPATHIVSVELTDRDGRVSEIRTFRR